MIFTAVLALVVSVEQPIALDVTDAGQPLDAGAQVQTADAGAPSQAAVEPEQDTELEEMRALEAAAIDPGAQPAASMRTTLGQLPAGTLTRDRLEAALDSAELSGDELAFELAAVTDVERFDVSLVKDRYDIPVEMQPLVVQYIHFFQGAGRKWFRKWMERSTRFIPVMQPLLEAKGLPRDTVYLAMIESGFNTQAKSWARAVGPWQFISDTGKLFKLKEDFWVDERRDPIKATNAAADYLGQLYQNLGHWYLAWAGYNTGGGNVRRLIEAYKTRDFWELSEKKGFAQETKHYVPKLIACALVAKHPDAFGFTPDEFVFEPTFEFDEAKLTDSVDLEVIAQASGATLAELQELNPEIKRWCTPPATEKDPYTVRLPKGRKEAFTTNFAKFAPSERLHFAIHRVVKGDTLSKLALNYHSAQEAILRMNHLPSARSLRVGTDLVIPVPSAAALKAGKSDVAIERQVARARRSGLSAVRPEEEVPAGSQPERTSTGKVAVGGSITVDTVGGKKRVTYGVGRGDSLWAIARRFDVHVADLKEWNDVLATGRGLKVGLALTVWPGANADLTAPTASTPAAAPKVTDTKPGTKHTVAAGDSMWTIARKYGCTVEDLKKWNSLGSGKLKKGQVLVVSQ
jgi:membrane-bound lytic murein transglycosylase D